MDYEGRTFEGAVTLDGNSYRNCTFSKVTLVYGGGSLRMENCRFEEFSWQFTGDLANGLDALYQLFGQEGLITIIRGFTQPAAGVVELPPKS